MLFLEDMELEKYSMALDVLEREPALFERLAIAASSTLERDELLQLIFAELNRALPCRFLGYCWRDSSGDLFMTAVISHASGIKTEQIRISIDPEETEEIPHSYCSNDNSRSPYSLLQWMYARGFASSLVVPVVVAQQTLGKLIASRYETHAFSANELKPLILAATLVGPALNSYRLYERLEIAHKDLTVARDELARSERLMVQGELASGVAHDINNILCLIAARADLLKLQGLTTQAVASVDAIRQAVDDGVAVLQRITQFTGKQRRQELVVLDLNNIVQDAIEMTRPRWQMSTEKKKAPIKLGFKPGKPTVVMGIPSELREVLVNLVINAVDAMPNGGKIHIEIKHDGKWAVLTVLDTGYGMDEEVRQHIFDPFFTTKGDGGSGLGLWVCQGIVARHGGNIQVESRLGEGSCFMVKLPIAKPVPQETRKKSIGQTHSILVVDDEVGIGETVKLSLEMVGYHVVFFSDPRKALEHFEANTPDLVITDLRMPGMSGWELAAEMKRISPATPIIALTGWPVDLVRDGQRNSNMEAIIQKPYKVNELRAKVAKILSQKSKNSN
jgi:signal transduction histidine kinase